MTEACTLQGEEGRIKILIWYMVVLERLRPVGTRVSEMWYWVLHLLQASLMHRDMGSLWIWPKNPAPESILYILSSPSTSLWLLLVYTMCSLLCSPEGGLRTETILPHTSEQEHILHKKDQGNAGGEKEGKRSCLSVLQVLKARPTFQVKPLCRNRQQRKPNSVVIDTTWRNWDGSHRVHFWITERADMESEALAEWLELTKHLCNVAGAGISVWRGGALDSASLSLTYFYVWYLKNCIVDCGLEPYVYLCIESLCHPAL